MASRVRDFMRMNPPKFNGSKVEENPQEFIDKLYKILDIMGVTLVEKAELTAYQLKGAAQIWFNYWKMEYALSFILLSKYGPSIVTDRRDKNSKFVLGVSDMIVKEYRTAILVHEMDISCLMVHTQQIKEEKLKEDLGRQKG
ncbi:hypothetical protein MTR67_044110 [Solanum verrucosum]|uniref:Gag-pol polyprotein n=1 Tax=Solanum verrucosum TaxID=315347 RepID=A0AAF0UQ93_SOLVR|nr:hypothetical protein MTR67_044110 [Solanum verrucosum]